MGRGMLLIVAMVAAVLAGQPAAATDYMDLIPSGRWLTIRSPWAPESYDECGDLQQSFAAEIEELSAQHGACLEGEPQEEPGSAGCTKASCQPLHSARDSARTRMTEETAVCRRRVAEHVAKEARDRQKAEEEQARRAQRAAQAQAEEDEAERDRAAQDAAAETERESFERGDDIGETTEPQGEAADSEPERADGGGEQAPRQPLNALDRTFATLKLARAAELAAKAAAELGSNPFEGAQAKAATILGRQVDKTLLQKGLDLATPELPATGGDPDLKRIHGVARAAQRQALGPNPFAKAIAGLAVSGVEHLQQKVVGETAALADQIASVEIGTAGTDGPHAASLQPGRAPSGVMPTVAPLPAGDPANPFAKASSPAALDDLPPGGSSGSDRVHTAVLEDQDMGGVRRDNPDNPFAHPAQPVVPTYFDPASHTTFSIPPGSALFRDRKSGTLEVIAMPSADKRYGDGARCSADGLGIVTPACEAERRRGHATKTN